MHLEYLNHLYSPQSSPYRCGHGFFSLSCFCSVVFHPTKDAILPGVLSHTYNFNEDLNVLFPECKCVFSVCSIFGDTILTDCQGDAKCLILWSLKNGIEITRIVRDKDVLSFARSLDGRLLAISHSTGLVCLLHAMNGFQTLAETVTSNECGIIKFSADRLFLFCWHFPPLSDPHFFRLSVNVENRDICSFDVSSDSFSYEPCEFESCSESGFTLGDPLHGFVRRVAGRFTEASFAFVVNKQSVLEINPSRDYIEMLSLNELTKDSDNRETIVYNLAFSVNGDTVYVVDDKVKVPRITAWDVSSGELKAENIIGSKVSPDCYLVPVKEGVLLPTSSGILELWNFELTECVQCWTDLRDITKMIPVSDERVVCEVIILDTTRGDIKTFTGRNRYGHLGSFVACSSKCQLITFNDRLLSSVLSVLWEKDWSPLGFEFLFSDCSVVFSPTEQLILIPRVLSVSEQGVCVLDASSGNTLHMLCAVERVYDCKFVSDEECVMHTFDKPSGYRLQLFNVRSGQLLSVINIGMDNPVYCVASCPGKSLVAIGLKHSEFKVIRVKLHKTT